MIRSQAFALTLGAVLAACAGQTPTPSRTLRSGPEKGAVEKGSAAGGEAFTPAVLPDANPRDGESAPSFDEEAEAASLLIHPADELPSTAPSSRAARASEQCNEQTAQDFLVRGHFLRAGPQGNLRAIQYRTDHYGYFKGYGHAGPDARPPSSFLEDITFFGLHVKMHRKVVGALRCVEQEIHHVCSKTPYAPHALAGIRYRNTYRGGEVTNHAYGIAIDIDPAENTCCGCVPPWNDAPACKRASKSEYDHMAMPECWVHAFERFGFYWLGHDVLKDTMHFEFLGDPDRIVQVPTEADAGSSLSPR